MQVAGELFYARGLHAVGIDEIIAKSGKDPGEAYRDLARTYGESAYDRVDWPATPEQKKALGKLSPSQVKSTELAGEKIETLCGSYGAIGVYRDPPVRILAEKRLAARVQPP